MSEELPKPTLEDALKKLRNLPDFKEVISFVADEREDMIGRFANVVNDGEAMKTAGAVAAFDKVLLTLRGS